LSTIVPSLAARDETNPVIHWLMTEARRRIDPNEFLEAFAHELRAADVDVSRITTGVPILHPQIFSFSGLLPRDQLIDLLNSYFGPMCDAVAEAGGEILKFIGDAMLATFPIGADAAQTCAAALNAAERAQAALADENGRRESAGRPRIDYGLALHVGDVMYGNIGSDTRLDFTVIGPAVNLTARIESMCRQLARQLLLSADFVEAGGIAARSLGAFSLKGVGADQEIFAPI